MQTTRWAALGLSVGDLIMARRQLLNLKPLAERDQHQGPATDEDQSRIIGQIRSFVGEGQRPDRGM